MKISVFGIGYVGAVTAACLSRDGHQVVAVDVNPDKVRSLAAGRSPITEPGLDALVADGVRRGMLSATCSAQEAIEKTEMSFVCVGTPVGTTGAPDLQYVERVIEQIGAALTAKSAFHSVIMRSTILPGTMERLVIPKLEFSSGLKSGSDFGVGFFPEFLREGSAIADYDRPGAVIFGVENDEVTCERLAALHAHLDLQPFLLPMRSAEAIKFANNAWHATKISFANEIGLICKALDVDSHDVMDALCQDTKLNISPAYLKPGFAFGGSCLPKDLRALRYSARRADLETPLLDATLRANENQLEHAYQMIERVGKRKVGLIGLSFKPMTDDMRSSPYVDLAERLIGRGYRVSIYDPIIRMARLTGANRDYISARLPHIGKLLLDKGEDLVEASDVIVVGNPAEAKSLLRLPSAADKIVIDLVRVERQNRSNGIYQGLCW